MFHAHVQTIAKQLVNNIFQPIYATFALL